MSQSPSSQINPESKVRSMGSMDPRSSHSITFTIEPYSTKADSFDLSYALLQREVNEMREMVEHVQDELRVLKDIVQVVYYSI